MIMNISAKPFFKSIKRETALLICIFLLALAVRVVFFNGLNWDDDPDYVNRVYKVKTGQGFIYTDNNGFRIGTYYPAVLTYALFGINDVGCGTYALAVSLLSIIAIYALGKLLFNERTGIIAALLLALYPLDVELASRLMPDGLLAGFSLFALYFLLKGDIQNSKSPGAGLQSKWSYVLCGLLLGWCTLVNMSAVVIILFVAVYFFFSLGTFHAKLQQTGYLKGFVNVVFMRYILLAGAFLAVAVIEGWAYYKVTGDFFFKFNNTLSHYAGNYGFCKDFDMYPRIMFHLDHLGHFRFRGWQNSYYGFYYIVAFFALIYGLAQLNINTYTVILWLLTVFCYLQWGSMSVTEYNPLHRLARHLSLATPPMILCCAFFLGNYRPEHIRKYAAPVIVLFLLVTSLLFNYYRHEHLTDSVLPQAEIHEYLEQLKPNIVYAANNTIAYQKFLDKFQDRGRRYIDIRRAGKIRRDGAYAIIGEFRNWRDVVRDILPNPYDIPANWELAKVIKVEGRLKRPPYKVRFFKLHKTPIKKLELKKRRQIEKHLAEKFPGAFKPSSKLILSWECELLDGIDELHLRGRKVSLQHIAFNAPEEITYKVFRPIRQKEYYTYRIIKEEGRGEVNITQQPSPQNNFTLVIRIDDGPFPSWDFYRFFLVADRK